MNQFDIKQQAIVLLKLNQNKIVIEFVFYKQSKSCFVNVHLNLILKPGKNLISLICCQIIKQFYYYFFRSI